MTRSAAAPSRAAAFDGTRNRILGALPADERARLAPHLERVELDVKQVVFDVDRPIEHVYFPEAAVVSLVGVMADGSAVETATVGREGMVGLPVFLGTDQTSAQAFAQIPGAALRIPADAFRSAVADSHVLTRALHRYTQALFTLVAQGSACNRLHAMVERCARWLLHTHDRVERDEFPLTHQFLSQMLGVRRATVTEAMGALQELGTVHYQMGRVRVRDRGALEAQACECYTVITREFDRLLGEAGPQGAAAGSIRRAPTAEGNRTALGDGAPPVEGDGAAPAGTADDFAR